MKKLLNTKLKDMKAITLIALVITIVVLIILATVAINFSLGENGIFKRAKTAKESYQNAEGYETSEISKLNNNIDDIANSTRSNPVSGKIYKVGTYNSVAVDSGPNVNTRLSTSNTIQINIAEKYSNYQSLTKDSFFTVDNCSWISSDQESGYICYGSYSSKIDNYNAETGILTLIKPFGFRDSASDTCDASYTGSVTLYMIENLESIDL